MDKLTRDSIASLWEVMWTVPHGNMSADEQVANVMLTMGSMKAVMEMAGVGHKDVADWIRADKIEIDLDGVCSQPEQDVEREEHKAMAERIMFLHHQRLQPKEQKFLESVAEQMDDGRFISPKQKRWLFDLARKYGV